MAANKSALALYDVYQQLFFSVLWNTTSTCSDYCEVMDDFFFKCIFYLLPHCCRQPEFPPLDESGRGRRMPWSLLCSSGEQVRSGLLAFLQLDVLPGTVNKANNWLRANAIVHFVSLWTLSCAIAADILQARWADIMATIYGKICANTPWQNTDII